MRVESKAGVLSDVCAALAVGDSSKAKTTLQEGYPFVPVEKIARRYSERESMKLFIRDSFIDRYTGNRLVNPGVLRLLHVVLEDDFPSHPHGKVSETHLAFWELFPTVDHVVPVSRGGRDDQSNWVTASMLSNQAKDQWMLDDLGWELHPPRAVAEWDGLSRWLVDYLAANPTVLADAAEPHRGYIRRWLTATKAALAESADRPVGSHSDVPNACTSRSSEEGGPEGQSALGARAPGHLALGAAGELLFASRIALLGYQVYRPLADDRGVDLVVDLGGGRHAMIQVKSVHPGSYIYMRKATFPLKPWVTVGVVVFDQAHEAEPSLFLIPATEWCTPAVPLVARDYDGRKSPPEFGLKVNKNWRRELSPWSATQAHIEAVLDAAHRRIQ